MKWKFWKKEHSDEKRETQLKVMVSLPNMTTEYYVFAQSPKEAEELMKKIKGID